MKDHIKTLLSSPSSKDSHSNIARINICQIFIIFLLRGAGGVGIGDGVASEREAFALSATGCFSSVDCLLLSGRSSSSSNSSSELIIFQCGYLLNSSAVVTPWVTPAKLTPAALAVAASTVLSPI